MTALTVGDAAPTFALADQHGKVVRLEDFKGRKLLVYFYPEADTPGCTTQSCDVRDHREEFANLGVDVVGISPDEPPAQLAFDEKYSLGFPLLSDPDHAVSEAWGTWGEKHELRQDLRRDDPLLVPRGRARRYRTGLVPRAGGEDRPQGGRGPAGLAPPDRPWRTGTSGG